LQRLIESAEDAADEPVCRGDWQWRSEFHDALLALRGGAASELAGEVQALANWALHGVGRASGCVASVRSLCPPATPAGQADLIRELFGNPFRKVRRIGSALRARVATWPDERQPDDILFVREWLACHDSAVRQLAQSIYAERRFEDLPYLADALEDAGCTELALLEHLRGPGEHVRGCWVVDLILGLG
jgi:hypothetical protein